MGFILKHFTGLKRFCKPFWIILTLCLLWAGVVWGLWPHDGLRVWRELAVFAVLGIWCAAWWYWSVVNPVSSRSIALPVGLFMVVCVAMAPFQSTDVYGYINRGWQQVAYGTNPYTTTISQLSQWKSDHVLTNHWVLNPCPYGPLFAHITRLTCQLAESKQWLSYAFKVSQWGVLLAVVWLIDRIRQQSVSQQVRLPLVALCWHPLILIHGLANGHNDGWVALGNVLAAWAVIPLPVLTPLALTLGGMVKVTPFVALPMTLLTLWRLSGIKILLASSGWCLVVTLLLVWAYLQHPEQIQWLTLIDNAGLSHNSLHALITDAYQPLADASHGGLPSFTFVYGWLKGVLWGLYGLLWVWLTFKPLNAKQWNWSQWLVTMLILQAGLLLLASSKFHGWYLNMLVPLVWLLPIRLWWVKALLAISLAYCFGVSFLGRAHIANTLLMTVLPVVLTWWHHRRAQGLHHPTLETQTP